jgi:hypothetical protein
MKAVMSLLLLLPLFAAESAAAARKDCDTLRSEIAAKIEANGVTSYSLQIVPPDSPAAGRVVGSCDGGSRRIVYQRLQLPADTATALRAAATAAPAFVSESAAQDRL